MSLACKYSLQGVAACSTHRAEGPLLLPTRRCTTPRSSYNRALVYINTPSSGYGRKLQPSVLKVAADGKQQITCSKSCVLLGGDAISHVLHRNKTMNIVMLLLQARQLFS